MPKKMPLARNSAGGSYKQGVASWKIAAVFPKTDLFFLDRKEDGIGDDLSSISERGPLIFEPAPAKLRKTHPGGFVSMSLSGIVFISIILFIDTSYWDSNTNSDRFTSANAEINGAQ